MRVLLALVAAASAERSSVLERHFRSMHAARATPAHDPSSLEHLSLATLRELARTPLPHLLEGDGTVAADDAFGELLRHESTRRGDETAEPGRYLACAPLDQAAKARARLLDAATDQHRPLYADKRNNAACWWTSQMSARAARDLHREDSPFLYVVPMPTAAKLGADLFPTPSVGEHLSGASVVVVLETRHETARASEATALLGRWSARSWGLSPPHDRDWLHLFYFTSDEGSLRHPAWADVRAALSLGACTPPTVRSTHPNRISLTLDEDERCALAAIAFLAAQPRVLSIHKQNSLLSRSKVSRPRGYVQPANEVSAESLQSGATDVLPLWENGINGTGIFVAVSDTGFDDASCWLRDTDSRATMSCSSIDATCAESDGGAADPYGDGCTAYVGNSHWCGRYDDADFSSEAMCCACGGGASSGDVTGATDCFSSAQVARSSYDSPVTDFTKRKVVQYVSYPFGTAAAICKLYDEEANGHGTHCAGTIAGSIARDNDYNSSICELHNEVSSVEYCSVTTCTADTDGGATDPYGDDCDDYATYTSWCGNYDDDDFTSSEMCCACGGGSRVCTEPSTERCPLGEGVAEEKGMAPEAKLMVFDFLGSADPSCDGSQPNEYSTETWKPAYDAGARISSNSWGSTLGDYGSGENDVDDFIYEKDDILILIAASNDGSFGPAGAIAREHTCRRNAAES